MEQIGNLKLYTFEEVLDEQIGKKGTPRRDEHERKVAEALRVYHVGEAIRKARQAQNLSQEQLGERMGVKKAQISKIESGRNITLATMIRAFKAMGVSASLHFGGMQISLS